MIHPCDGHTDGRAIAYTRYSIYAVASGGQIQIIIWFKSWLNYVIWFEDKDVKRLSINR